MPAPRKDPTRAAVTGFQRSRRRAPCGSSPTWFGAYSIGPARNREARLAILKPCRRVFRPSRRHLPPLSFGQRPRAGCRQSTNSLSSRLLTSDSLYHMPLTGQRASERPVLPTPSCAPPWVEAVQPRSPPDTPDQPADRTQVDGASPGRHPCSDRRQLTCGTNAAGPDIEGFLKQAILAGRPWRTLLLPIRFEIPGAESAPKDAAQAGAHN